jgi:hypothetical protein
MTPLLMGRKLHPTLSFRPVNREGSELAGYSVGFFSFGGSGGRRPALYSA